MKQGKNSRRWRQMGLALVLLGAAQWAPAIGYGGFENTQPTRPGTERILPLTLSETSYDIGYSYSQALPVAPDWVTALEVSQGVMQSYYAVNVDTVNVGGFGGPDGFTARRKTLMIDIVTTAPEITAKNFTARQMLNEPEKFKVRMLLDLNNNHKFEAEEIRTAILQRQPQPGLPPGMVGPSVMMARATFESPNLTLPNGKPMPVDVGAQVINYGMSIDEMDGGTGESPRNSRIFQVRTHARLPLVAALDPVGGPRQILRLIDTGISDPIVIARYMVVANENEMGRPNGRGQVALSEPLRIGERWWMIKSIARDLGSVTLAEPGEGFKAPERAQVGDTLPDFARVNIVSRSIITPTDYRGKFVVFAMSGNNASSQYQYNGYRLMSERLHKDGGERVAVIFAVSSVNYEEFFAETSGREELGFALVGNRDFLNRTSNEERNNLATIFWSSEGQPLTIVANPEGKIVMREQKDLYDLLPRVLELLRAANK